MVLTKITKTIHVYMFLFKIEEAWKSISMHSSSKDLHLIGYIYLQMDFQTGGGGVSVGEEEHLQVCFV